MQPSDVQPPPEEPRPEPRARGRRRGDRDGRGNGHDGLAPEIGERLRSLRDALRAARQGDFSVRLPEEADGEGLLAEVAIAFNALVAQNGALVSELDRVAQRVGREGKVSERATLGPAGGAWASAVGAINALIESTAFPTMEASRILDLAVAGDLSQDMGIHLDRRMLDGAFLELGSSVNAVMRRLRSVTTSVSKIVREIGAEGKLGGQAGIDDLQGTWKVLIDDVNLLANNLTAQVRNIALVSTAIAKGDLSQKITVETRGEILELKNAINATVDQLRSFATEVIRVAREVGTEGKLGAQADVRGVSGVWQELTNSVNRLASNLTLQVRNIALVSTAIANGDLSQKLTVEAQGEILELKNTINTVVDQLRTFAAEVTRVAREVGTEGKLGGQARVPGVAGTWKDLTDNVNVMASNLTTQVRGIAKVVAAVAGGDLSQKFVVEAKGEIASLADTINAMTDTLRTLAEQVTTVAREVGIEGKLGGQARVPGVAGTWRDLTDNVNQLAANLTNQVRAIADVATAVIHGDLTRTITVGARGEVLALKDTINQMIANLRDTTRTNKEQDWLKTNLARFFGLMQGQRNLQALADSIMSELTPVVSAQRGAFYLVKPEDSETVLKLTSTYAYLRRRGLSNRFALGEGLIGQCALERKPIVVSEIPEDYMPVVSGLGEAPPRNVAVLPILFEDKVRGVVELGSFHEFTPIQITFLEQLMLNIGLAINLIGTSMRTEELLQQLQGSNVELESRRRELEEKAQLLEVRNREIAEASRSLEGKAQELSKVSQYKSQFLANMSHEIRTPLNSMMILAQLLSANEEKRLSPQQQEWAATIHAAGRDLLALINQILDLSKVEAGRITVRPESYPIDDLRQFAERTFRPVALQRNLGFRIDVANEAPPAVTTDRQLIEQILRNLLSNAFKFTERGQVVLRIGRAPAGVRLRGESLRRAPEVVAFAVSDTGLGIPLEQQERIFEAFQQGDASITRKFGGTGLGLTITREYARVLGGEITVESVPGEGSTFTLYLPREFMAGAGVVAGLAAPMAEPAPPAPAVGPEDARALAGRKLLVVEDDERNLYALTSFLERYQARVIPASSAREAYSLLHEHPDVELVLMDIRMPEIDGYQATREIRAMPGFAATPIIAHTAKASNTDRSQCFAAGCNDYIVKPVDNQQLLSVLLRHLRR